MSLFRNAALIATSALVLAACQRSEPAADAATDAAAQQTVPAAATVATAPAAIAGPHIASVKVGRYIEPKTFQVGGVATKFKQGEKLFAMVQLANIDAPTRVDVALIDAQGGNVAGDSKTIAAKGAHRANFSLAPATALAAGSYTLEATMEGQAQPESVSIEVR